MKTFACCILSLLLALTAGADTDNEEQPLAKPDLAFTDEYELTIVNLLAHVTDKNGNPVTDLTQADFRVLQDGQEVKITNFQAYTEEMFDEIAAQAADAAEVQRARQPAEVAMPEEPNEPEALRLVIYVDNKNIHPLERNRLLPYLSVFVGENLRPPAQAMVVAYDQTLEVEQPFTSDPHAINDTLRSFRKRSGGRVLRDSARQEVLKLMNQELEEQGLGSGYGSNQNRAYNAILTYADEEAHELAYSMDALREVVSSLAGLPGRKAILYLSNGLPMVPGFGLASAYADTFHDNMILNEINRRDRSQAFRSLVAQANAQGITFYTVGAGGLEVMGVTSATLSSRGPVSSAPGVDTYVDGLRFMAERTGGLAVVMTNDFEEGFDRISKDLHHYYSLGYRLTATGRDKIHRVEITLPDHPELELRYQRRFVEKNMESQVQDKMVAQLLHDFDDNPMELELTLGTPSLADGEHWVLPVHVSTPIRNVAMLPEGDVHVGKLILFAAARESGGDRSEPVRQEYELRLPAARYELSLQKQFGIDVNLLMKAGRYRVAIGLLDQTTGESSYCTASTTIPSP